jgi:hypothetical protein
VRYPDRDRVVPPAASSTLAARMAGRHARLMAGAEREGLILTAKVRLGKRRLGFAVIGDTINVASRIEGLTRVEGSSLLVSGELVEAAKRAGAGTELLSKLRPLGERPLRGRGEAVGMWGLAEAARAASARDAGSMATATPLA